MNMCGPRVECFPVIQARSLVLLFDGLECICSELSWNVFVKLSNHLRKPGPQSQAFVLTAVTIHEEQQQMSDLRFSRR
jgi:hypothetical protein